MLLILFLVIAYELPLLVFGVRTTGRVVDLKVEIHSLGDNGTMYPLIRFSYDGQLVSIYGPENSKYQIGDEVKLIFYKRKPGNAKVLSFAGLYLKPVIEFIIGLLLWYVFILSFSERFINRAFRLKKRKFLGEFFEDDERKKLEGKKKNGI